MKNTLRYACPFVLGLGLAACGTSNGTDDADIAGNPDTTPAPTPDAAIPMPDTAPPAVDTAPAAVDTAAPMAYTWVVVQDTEQVACLTNGPGADIDAVVLNDATNTAIGYGLIGSARFTANPLGNACANTDCNGGNCKYAAISTTIPATTLIPYTEGPPDAVVNSVGNDSGYFSLNAGTLQIQIGDLTGGGVPQAIKSGDRIIVYEVDQTYITSGAAPLTCSCLPEHYTVSLQTDSGATLALKPGSLAADNATCSALTAASTEGCGTTVFVVP
jgi:hypothetical protein